MKFLALPLCLSTAAALGINCRGSFMCPLDNGASLQNLHDQIGNLVATGKGSRHYGTGEQIACSQGSQGSICAFYQNGASGTAQDAYGQVQQLLDHNCQGCGSLPTQPGNDVKNGELTVNYVTSACCSGDCTCG